MYAIVSVSDLIRYREEQTYFENYYIVSVRMPT